MNSLVVWMDKVGREGPRRAAALFDNRVERTAAMRFGFKSRPLLFLVLFGIVAFPLHAWANGGTPLMWTTSLHLLFGNAIIGIGEGVLLAWLFSLPERKCIATMVVANYASAWLGVLFIQETVVDALPMDLTNEWMWFWGMVAATYCMTLLLEWPFIARCFRGTQDWFRRSVRASLVVQSVSYILLFGWYWLASDTSLYSRMNVVASADLSLPESVLVYFISPADGDVYKRQLTGGIKQKIFELNSTNIGDRLFIRQSRTDSNRWDLVASVDIVWPCGRYVDVLTNMMVEAVPDRSGSRTDPADYGKVQSLGSATNSHWEFRTRFWPKKELQARNKTTSESVRFSYETFFGAWVVRNAVHLPSDKVLFQFGDDQICAFDPVRRRVGLLWKGRGPVPVIEKANVEQ
jgi:hypothetical protein